MQLTTKHAESFCEAYHKAVNEAYGYDGNVDLDPFLILKALEKVFGVEEVTIKPFTGTTADMNLKLNELIEKWQEAKKDPNQGVKQPMWEGGVYVYSCGFPGYTVSTGYTTGADIVFKKDGE